MRTEEAAGERMALELGDELWLLSTGTGPTDSKQTRIWDFTQADQDSSSSLQPGQCASHWLAYNAAAVQAIAVTC